LFSFKLGRRDWKLRQETAWYVCTLALTAEHANATVRSHWGIENAFHHVRDVAMCEDASQIRKQPGIFARLRSWALNLIRISGTQHIYATRQTLGWDAQAAWNCLTAYDEK
jgi:predicted transposase YbfD/YdcC